MGGTIPPVDSTCFTPHNLHKSYFYLNRNLKCGAASFGLTGYLFRTVYTTLSALFAVQCTVHCALCSAQCSVHCAVHCALQSTLCTVHCQCSRGEPSSRVRRSIRDVRLVATYFVNFL